MWMAMFTRRAMMTNSKALWLLKLTLLLLLLLLPSPQPVNCGLLAWYRWLMTDTKTPKDSWKVCADLRLSGTGPAGSQAAHLARMWFTHLILSAAKYSMARDLPRWQSQILRKAGCELNEELVHRLDSEADPKLIETYVKNRDRAPPSLQQAKQSWFSWPEPMLQAADMESCPELQTYLWWEDISSSKLRPLFLPQISNGRWYDWREARRRLVEYVHSIGSRRRRRRRRRKRRDVNNINVNNNNDSDYSAIGYRQPPPPPPPVPSISISEIKLKSRQLREILLMQALLCPLKQDYRLSAEYVRSQVSDWQDWVERSKRAIRDQTLQLHLWTVLSTGSGLFRGSSPAIQQTLFRHVVMNVLFDYSYDGISFDTSSSADTNATTTSPEQQQQPEPPIGVESMAVVTIPREYLFFATFPLKARKGYGFEQAEHRAVLDSFVREELSHLRTKCGYAPRTVFMIRRCRGARLDEPIDPSNAQWSGDVKLSDETLRYLNRWTELLLTICPAMRAIVPDIVVRLETEDNQNTNDNNETQPTIEQVDKEDLWWSRLVNQSCSQAYNACRRHPNRTIVIGSLSGVGLLGLLGWYLSGGGETTSTTTTPTTITAAAAAVTSNSGLLSIATTTGDAAMGRLALYTIGLLLSLIAVLVFVGVLFTICWFCSDDRDGRKKRKDHKRSKKIVVNKSNHRSKHSDVKSGHSPHPHSSDPKKRKDKKKNQKNKKNKKNQKNQKNKKKKMGRKNDHNKNSSPHRRRHSQATAGSRDRVGGHKRKGKSSNYSSMSSNIRKKDKKNNRRRKKVVNKSSLSRPRRHSQTHSQMHSRHRHHSSTSSGSSFSK